MDGREVLLQEGFAEVGRIQPDVVHAETLHLEVDGAGDHIARCQFGALVVRQHEAGAVRQTQEGSPRRAAPR